MSRQKSTLSNFSVSDSSRQGFPGRKSPNQCQRLIFLSLALHAKLRGANLAQQNLDLMPLVSILRPNGRICDRLRILEPQNAFQRGL
jgi:hypothetical protein